MLMPECDQPLTLGDADGLREVDTLDDGSELSRKWGYPEIHGARINYSEAQKPKRSTLTDS